MLLLDIINTKEKLKPVVKNDSIVEALKKVLPEKYHHLLVINKQALEKGEALVNSLTEPILH